MGTPFLSGLSSEVKPFIDGAEDGISGNKRYALVNSRNYNRKVFRLGATLTTQKLGIEYPTVAPTGTPGTGANLYYCYVYVNKKFMDGLALEPDSYIRSNASPVLTIASVSTAATVITPTLSTDSQVTHLWLYVSDNANGPFVRLPANYEVANTASPTWTGVTALPLAGYTLETDNAPLDTCRHVTECNGFYLYAGFVPIDTTASVTVGSYVVTGTFPDGVTDLNLQFSTDTTGGMGGNGIHLLKWVDASTVWLVDATGTARNYDGPGNKAAAACRIWRTGSVVEISKRWNQDFTPAFIDAAFEIKVPGNITGISKPSTGYSVRIHSNDHGKKSVILADFTEGVPARTYITSSAYAMANPRAWVAAGNRLFYYDRDAGVIEDKGNIHFPITLPVIPNLLRSLGANSEDIAEMEYDESRNIIFLSCCPSGYNVGYYLISYNLTTNAWNLWFMLPDVLCMRRFKDETTGKVTIKFGSSKGSVTVWPSTGFNEAVGSSIAGTIAAADDSTHLTVPGTPFLATDNKLIDRWVMVWDDSQTVKTYQFARVSDNTSSRLTLDTFIGAASTTQFSPVPDIGWSFWMGPIQSILGPCFDYNTVPDADGQLLDVSIATSGLGAGEVTNLELYRNFETTASTGQAMVHPQYQDGTPDPDHQTVKLGVNTSIETTGVTGWKLTDNNESPLSFKALVLRVRGEPNILPRRMRES